MELFTDQGVGTLLLSGVIHKRANGSPNILDFLAGAQLFAG
jgi:hypothetical protein